MNCLTTDQNLTKLNQQIHENIGLLAKYLNIEIYEANDWYLGCCPVHGGDNPTALNISRTKTGYWRCNTHECHKYFSSYPTGLIRGILSHKQGWYAEGDLKVSLNATINWCNSFFKNEKIEIKSDTVNLDSLLTKNINSNTVYDNLKSLNLSREQFRNKLSIPSQYFLKRGFLKQTLNFFDIGDCEDTHKSMYGRALVPVYDKDGKSIIACTGRSIYEKCKLCKSFHNPYRMCPSKEYIRYHCKWKHSKYFPANTMLYNYNNALSHVKTSKTIILVEGCGSVWRLYEAGFPMTVAAFGVNLGKKQKKLIDESGAETIVILRDVVRGEKLVENVQNACENTYNIIIPEPNYEDDPGDCDINKLKELLKNII